MEWSFSVRDEYGSIMNYIVQRRLKWQMASEPDPHTGSFFRITDPVPFRNSQDWKILPNDWPYGFEPGIFHLIIWLKHRLETEPTKGDLTAHSRQQVQTFVDDTFRHDIVRLGGTQDRIVWFKNWTALQTVPGIDHIHVLIRDIPDAVLKKWLEL